MLYWHWNALFQSYTNLLTEFWLLVEVIDLLCTFCYTHNKLKRDYIWNRRGSNASGEISDIFVDYTRQTLSNQSRDAKIRKVCYSISMVTHEDLHRWLSFDHLTDRLVNRNTLWLLAIMDLHLEFNGSRMQHYKLGLLGSVQSCNSSRCVPYGGLIGGHSSLSLHQISAGSRLGVPRRACVTLWWMHRSPVSVFRTFAEGIRCLPTHQLSCGSS